MPDILSNATLCSVIVTTFRRADPLKSALVSLLRQTYRSMEIVVVSDGPDPETERLSSTFKPDGVPLHWVFHPENRGLPAARNTGARVSSGEILLFLDDDVIAEPELVSVHIAHHLAVSPMRRIVVQSLATNKSEQASFSPLERFLNASWDAGLDALAAEITKSEVDSVSDEVQKQLSFGLNCSIRRELFEVTGGFQENLRDSDEEMEFGLRLYLAGAEHIFEPRRLLLHLNASRLENYFPKCWRSSGSLDVYRVFQLHEKNVQTARLMAMHRGPFLHRMTARICWNAPLTCRTLTSVLGRAANRTGSSLLAGAWGRTSQLVEYWTGVRETGCPAQLLEGAQGQDKCALMLHSIAKPLSADEASYYVSPERFHRLMRWFRRRNYKTATLAQWLANELPPQHVLLTFDDAYDDLYENLMPLIQEHGYRPVIYVVADQIGGNNVWDQPAGLRARRLLTLEQIRDMQRCGAEFGSHSLSHPWLPAISDEQLRREIFDSKHRLEDLLGTEIQSFAYPYGGVDRRVRSFVAQAGYKLAFTTQPGLNWWNDPLCQRRAEVNDWTSVSQFSMKLRNGRTWVESVAARMREMEHELPTRTLRTLARGGRRLGHRAFRALSREGRSRET